MRIWLNRLHLVGAVLAGVLLVAVAVLTLVPIVLRLLGLPAHSWDEVATFCMAGSAFLGLAVTWRSGGHVRMELIVARLPGAAGRWMQRLALVITLTACAYFTVYSVRFVRESYSMNDLSQGLLPIPLWIPQLGMVAGLLLMCLAVGESLFDALGGRADVPAASGSAVERAASEL
ncbi:MAG: TRAP transporter small permease subunit [Burkholderiales bacterium]|nr:TRAP transporter small permease subunit [Burkholderiales bacterium]